MELRIKDIDFAQSQMVIRCGKGGKVGQLGYFSRYAPVKIELAIDRYTNEAKRLLGVLDKRLGVVEFLAGDYSLAKPL